MDLAPHNILVTPDVQVKVLDFGISRATGIQRIHTRRSIRGRTAYLAPEQLWGLPLDQRLDIYALGVMIHEMVLCRPLFRAQDDQTTAKRILYAQVPRLCSRRSDCPEGLERLVLRALKRDRDKRFSTMSELLADLDRCQEQEGIACVPSRMQDEIGQLLQEPAPEQQEVQTIDTPAELASRRES
jgi:serine/threonine-protein kinase